MSVGRGFGDDMGAKGPAGTDAIFYDDRTSDLLRNLIQCDARNDVCRAAGGERGYCCNGLAGPSLGMRSVQHSKSGQQAGSRQKRMACALWSVIVKFHNVALSFLSGMMVSCDT
jgi:hypothetical protein